MSPDEILKGADQCVKCGFCLPHCPTYKLLANEADSPRGRISLMQGLLTGALEKNSRLEAHLDLCLSCRACEPVCPSGVSYDQLLAGTREQLAKKRSPLSRFFTRLPLTLTTQPRLLRLASILLRLLQASGLQDFFRQHPGLLLSSRLSYLNLLAPPVQTWQPIKPESHHNQTKTAELNQGRSITKKDFNDKIILLFPGCISRIVEQDVLQATYRVLTTLGYRVVVPEMPLCCGALHRHDGETAHARRRIQSLEALDATLSPKWIVGIASACTAELREQAKTAAKIQEINQFLLDAEWPDKVSLNPLNARVAFHLPCSHRNALCEPDSAIHLLSRIPDIEIQPLPGNDFCCGAAGSYMLRQSQLAQTLRQEKLDKLNQLRPDILVTTNTGCAIFLEAGLRLQQPSIEVLHPVQLINRQLSIDEAAV